MALRVPKAELTAELSDSMIDELGDVLEYAEAMTNTPPTVTDELSARLTASSQAPSATSTV